MQIAKAAKMLVGSMVVYVVMAACAASNNVGQLAGGDDGGPTTSGDVLAGSMGDVSAGAAGDGTAVSDVSLLDVASEIVDAVTDPVSEAKAQQQSGTRLKANWLVGADGSRQFVSWHDSQVGADCTFVPAADSTVRCLPSTPGAGGPFYADPACSQTLGAKQTAYCANLGAPTVITLPDTTQGITCTVAGGYIGYPSHVYPVQSAYAVQTTDGGANINAFQKSATNCIALPSLYSTLYNFYNLGAEMAASQFVQATVQTDP